MANRPHRSKSPARKGKASTRVPLDTTAFNPNAVAQGYSTRVSHPTGRTTTFAPSLLTSSAPHSGPSSLLSARQSSEDSADDVFNLARHYHSEAPTKPMPTSTAGFYPQSEQFNAVDQSVNFMDHTSGNYSPNKPRRTGRKGKSSRRSFVDIFLSRRGDSAAKSAGTATETVPEEDTERKWPVFVLYFLITLGVVLGAAFLALSVPSLKKSLETSEEKMEERVASIQGSLVDSGLTAPITLQDASSSQHHALQWLSRTDPARLKADDPRLQRRFALANLFYSNHPETAADHSRGRERRLLSEWKNTDKWMSGANACDWYGVECKDVGGHHKVVVGWNMTGNNLKGPIPSEIRAMSSLVSLDLSGNQMTGTIPETLYSFSSLKYLVLRDNSFSGPISDEIGFLYTLTHVDFSCNDLSGTLPKSINTAVNLEYLSLEDNDLKGTIPNMTRMASLETLILDQNKFVGKFPASLTKLPSLSYLSIEDNQLSGSLPSALGAMSSLEVLSLGHNQFNGGIPDVFEGLLNLTEVRLQKNLLQHKLPLSLGGLPKLKKIMLDSNRLVGPIPTEWTASTALQALVLHDNELAGSLPSEIGNLVRLKDLWLNKNHISGDLPPQLGNLTDLNTLYLHENSFVGTLPSEIGMLQDLQAMRLAGTKLVGVVPNEVCALKGRDELIFLSATCTHLHCICCDRCL